jgi:hypothetical protein
MKNFEFGPATYLARRAEHCVGEKNCFAVHRSDLRHYALEELECGKGQIQFATFARTFWIAD